MANSDLTAAVRAGSINAAARELGLGQPQLTRQLTHLEKAVGCKLLDRSATGIGCTPAGLEALALAIRLFPDEAVCSEGELRILGRPGDVADLENGVLQMRGDHGKVFTVECKKLQIGHAGCTPGR